MSIENTEVDAWMHYLIKADIPVLKQTARALDRLKEDEDRLSPREIAMIVIADPLMVFRILSYVQQHKNKHQLHDVIFIEQAIMMMGTTTFYNTLHTHFVVEDVLKDNLVALTHLLRLIKRVHRAAHYASDWAAIHRDMHLEEVRIAALLHDLAEMLMWCFLPIKMNTIYDMQHKDKSLRSKAVQKQELGFELIELQYAVIEAFKLPPLLGKLMHDDHQEELRVRNVILAVNLARHSANGWDDAALPDDYEAIAEFLRVDVERVKFLIGVPQ